MVLQYFIQKRPRHSIFWLVASCCERHAWSACHQEAAYTRAWPAEAGPACSGSRRKICTIGRSSSACIETGSVFHSCGLYYRRHVCLLPQSGSTAAGVASQPAAERADLPLNERASEQAR